MIGLLDTQICHQQLRHFLSILNWVSEWPMCVELHFEKLGFCKPVASQLVKMSEPNSKTDVTPG